jgi:hypothetical protein
MDLLLAHFFGRSVGRGGRLGVGSYQSITRIKVALKLALPFFLPVLQLLAQNNQAGKGAGIQK